MPEPEGFEKFAQRWLPLLDTELRNVLERERTDFSEAGTSQNGMTKFYGMIHYHMGWLDESLHPGDFDGGKRIRPLLCLMAAEAVGGNPECALPAAAGIEILHNFSLVHDDIEDGDRMRRHRPTVWAVWGVPHAINAGDAMFSLAYRALLRSTARGVSPGKVLAAIDRFTRTTVALTEGQHLDLSFEKRRNVSVDEYMQMIAGKTASLIAASLSVGALVGGAEPDVEAALYRFGYNIGMTFQIRDDILGIWGDPSVTGKAVGNDLVRQKKSLPVLYALEHEEIGPQLEQIWRYAVGGKQVPHVLDLLERADARCVAEEKVLAYHRAGMEALEEAFDSEASNSPLMALADELLDRRA